MFPLEKKYCMPSLAWSCINTPPPCLAFNSDIELDADPSIVIALLSEESLKLNKKCVPANCSPVAVPPWSKDDIRFCPESPCIFQFVPLLITLTALA